MAKKKLFKSKTNFSIRRLHQSGNFGNIYERDYSTIVNSLDNPGGQIPILNSPTFKITVGAGVNKKKRYHYGDWIGNPYSLNNNWTLDNMPNSEQKGNLINVETYSKRLTDFVCYGSSYELIKTSLRNIVSKYPAEIFVTDTTLMESGIFDLENNLSSVSTGSTMFNYIDYLIVDNPMLIDIIQNSVSDFNVLNQLRYISNSIYEYDIISANGDVILSGNEFKKWNETNDGNLEMWEVLSPTDNDKPCFNNGDLIANVIFNEIKDNKTQPLIEIYCFYLDGELLYLTDKNNKNIRIRPNKDVVEKFFNELNDFEKILLNRNTNYTSTFETYYENEETGWQMYEKKYTWPTTLGDWNIAINGLLYSGYIDDLTKLALGYDELFTNSIQRDMTHEAINNMDMTGGVVINEDDEIVNSSNKMSKVLNSVGRQFDEIKKYADNIKNTNLITYTRENNIPDYFLSDNLNLSGWEIKEILNDVSKDTTTPPMYSDKSTGYTVKDVNSEFMRRLKLNSKYILSKKGTKQCIEDLMAIFGYHSTDWLKRYYGSLMPKNLRKAYILTEHTYVANGYASNKTSDDVIRNVKRINQLKDSYDIEGINNPDSIVDDYQGLPVAEVDLTIPIDANVNNIKIVDEIPTEKIENLEIKYLKRLDNYYEWVGYKELSEAPTNSSGSEKINGTVVPSEKTSGNTPYIFLNLYYYQWSGYYRKIIGVPSDAVNNSNVKIIQNINELNVRDSRYKYVMLNGDYYSWDFNGNNNNGCYVILNQTPNDVRIKNTKVYNSVPSIKDESAKYVIVRGEYYEWDGKYVLMSHIPSDSYDNTAFVDSLPKEKHKSKKYVSLNTYFVWVGSYVLYNKKILIPWFDKTLKYDGDTYFQMKGAWGRNDGKTDTTGTTENSFYSYSICKIHYVATMDELYAIPYRLINNNTIYYVGDEDIYLKIKDLDKHTIQDGWEYPSDEEIEQYTRIIESNRGNNPHTGDYDNGYEYLEAYGELFKNSTFNNVKNIDVEDVSLYGFNISRYGESTKCMFFGDSDVSENLNPLRGGKKINAYNFLGGESYEETASLSIINSKEFHITFDESHREFIEKDVIPLISQVIPSTTIFSYSFEHLTGNENAFTARTHDIICDGNICPIFGIV